MPDCWEIPILPLAEPLDAEQGAWAVRLHYKPLVRWIWLGAVLMAFWAGMFAVLDRRYRTLRDACGGAAASGSGRRHDGGYSDSLCP